MVILEKAVLHILDFVGERSLTENVLGCQFDTIFPVSPSEIVFIENCSLFTYENSTAGQAVIYIFLQQAIKIFKICHVCLPPIVIRKMRCERGDDNTFRHQE